MINAIVNNSVINIYAGTRWILEGLGGQLCKLHDCPTTTLHM